jgi:hypothetical protein
VCSFRSSLPVVPYMLSSAHSFFFKFSLRVQALGSLLCVAFLEYSTRKPMAFNSSPTPTPYSFLVNYPSLFAAEKHLETMSDHNPLILNLKLRTHYWPTNDRNVKPGAAPAYRSTTPLLLLYYQEKSHLKN